MLHALSRLVAASVCALASAPTPAAVGLDFSTIDTGSPAYLRFKGWVDTAVAGQPGYAFSPTDAVYMHRLNGAPGYCALAVSMVENEVAAAEALIGQGQRPAVSGDSYLEVGEMIGALALTWDACSASLSPSQRSRWADYAEQAIWNIWHPDLAQWGGILHPWSGWSINDPGNNYHYSFLEATMLWGLASDSNSNHCGAPNRNAWVDFLASDTLPTLSAFYADLDGGGSREGTGYGTAQMRLFWLYRIWRDAGCGDLAASSNHVADTIPYWVHATVPTADRFAPIGDQSRSSLPELFDYQRRLVLEARALVTDPQRRAIADHWLARISVPQMQQGFNFRHDLLGADQGGEFPSERHWHASGTGHLFARTDWTADALWMAFVAGRFDQSHAHEDQGAFTLFGRRDWLAVSENIWTHSGIQQGGEVHNVLRFERAGQALRQRRDTEAVMLVERQQDDSLLVEADLTAAYAGQAGLQSWQRELRFDNDGLRVHDVYQVESGTRAVFQINTPTRPRLLGNNTVRAGDLLIRVLSPASVNFSVLDWHSVEAAEFNSGWRLDIEGSGGEYLVELRPAGGFFSDGFENRGQ